MPAKTHGKSRTKLYQAWFRMVRRCRDPKCTDYYLYGARGIRVCKRWEKFENFYSDMGEPPLGKTLDRIKNGSGYSPANCRWATPREQTLNSRRSWKLTFGGKKQSLQEWSEQLGISPNTLRFRIRYQGWSVKRALTTPAGKQGKQNAI